MAYVPNTWANGDIITAAKLDRLEAGVAAAAPQAAMEAVFPTALPVANAAQLTSWAVADYSANCPHPPGSGSEIVFAGTPEPDRYDWLGGAGKPYTYVWNGNRVLRAGTAKDDIGIVQTVFRCRTNADWLMLQSQMTPSGSTFDGVVQVRINGVLVWPKPQVASGTYQGAFAGVDLTFADTSWKTVEVFQCGWLYSVSYSAGSTMQPWVVDDQKKLLIVGDSWCDGTLQSRPERCIPAALQAQSAWDVSYNGQGGTGYVAGGPNPWQAPFGAAPRLAAVTDYQPDVLVAFGSINDNTLAGVEAAATSYYEAIASVSPATKVIVVGPQIGDSENPASAAALSRAAAAAPNVIGYLTPYEEGWDVDGARGPSDGAHPSILGVRWYAQLLEAAVLTFTVADGDNTW